MLKGRPLANWCCMCCRDGESTDHLLLHCPVTHSLWSFMFQAFGIHWVMPGSVVGLLSSWHQWLGKHKSDILELGSRMLNVDCVVGTKSSIFWGQGEDVG